MEEVENILRIFKETKEALKKEDPFELSNLSNQTINTASRTQDPDNIATAVIVYSLGKIISRQNYKQYTTWPKFEKSIFDNIDKLISALKKNDQVAIRNNLEEIRNSLSLLSGDFKKSIEDVFRKAAINKASKIYEHGISMETTSKLLGVTLFELASYSGQANITEPKTSKMISVKQRIKIAEDIFKK